MQIPPYNKAAYALPHKNLVENRYIYIMTYIIKKVNRINAFLYIITVPIGIGNLYIVIANL